MLTAPGLLPLLLALALGARPPSPEEQRAFTEGLRLYEAGDARGAERLWKEGYAIGRDPAFLVRIAEAQEKAGAVKEAVESYELYLRESRDAADRAEIEGRIRRLAPTRAPAPAPADAEEAPGEIGEPPAPGGARPPRPVPAPARAPAPAAPQAIDRSEQLRALVEEDEPARSGLNVGGWVATGVTAALLGVAAFYGASAAEKAGDASRLLVYSDQRGVPLEYAGVAARYEDAVEDGERYAGIARGLLIAAGVTAATATVLFVVDAVRAGPGPRRPAVRRDRASARWPGLGWSF
jgi:hypothetical protein